MQIKKLFIALILGPGLILTMTLALDGVAGLDSGPPVVRAASFTVTKKSDTNDGICDSDCSLREAIVAANGNSEADTITLGPGRFGLSIIGTGENAGNTGDLDITDALIIKGVGPGQTIIDASGIISDRVFDIRPGAGAVVISGVTIINGNVSGLGGGIYSYNADLTLINVEVRNNVVTGTSSNGRGGGIYIHQGNLLLDGGQIVSNSATNRGGGLYLSYGSATLNSGQIISNAAGFSGGGVTAYSAGAAFTQTGDSMVAYNTANQGGGVYLYHGSATLLKGQILSNTASAYGGGVCVYQSGARFTMSGGKVIHNRAGQRGGGMYVYYNSSATMSGGEIINNTSADDGGGVYVNSGVFTQSGGSLAHNAAANYGGGVYVFAGNAALNGGQIITNTARLGGGVYVANGSAALSGGQIFSNTASANGGGIYNLNGMLTLVNTTLSGNRAGAQGGGLYHNGGVSALTYTTVASNTAYTGGGGIRGGSAITLQNSIVANNNAANCAGALTSNGHNLDSGATCGFAASGDITSANPLFGPPVKDSGTLVYPLLKGSPAINAGICVAEITADQRGVSRPQGDGCDIGAYEFAEYTIYLPLVLNN